MRFDCQIILENGRPIVKAIVLYSSHDGPP